MSFERDLNAFVKDTGVELEQVVRKVALDVHNRVSEKTPVDTGRARGNWNVKAGSPDLSTDNTGLSSVLTLKKGDGNKPIYITNNLPYAQKLEDGHSKQAPAGMVALTMAEIDAGIKNVIRR